MAFLNPEPADRLSETQERAIQLLQILLEPGCPRHKNRSRQLSPQLCNDGVWGNAPAGWRSATTLKKAFAPPKMQSGHWERKFLPPPRQKNRQRRRPSQPKQIQSQPDPKNQATTSNNLVGLSSRIYSLRIKTIALAVTAEFVTIPPIIIGPTGVDRIPWLSMRTS
jgi:hypothetical protein